MPATRKAKRPHPRSLDALFPKPKVKRCARGHSQMPDWRPTRGCSTCTKIDLAAASAFRAVVEQMERENEAMLANIPSLPAAFVIPVRHGPDLRFAIPPRLQRRGPAKRPGIRTRHG